MWTVLLIPCLLVLYDYSKTPIDRLYFNNPKRILMGMRNTLTDILLYAAEYSIYDYPGLWLIKLHLNKIRQEYEKISKTACKYIFHETDPWFEKNDGYYFYKVEDFPELKSLIDQIPSIDKETAIFSVMEGPVRIPPHRAESNHLLRYHITILGGGDCILQTDKGPHVHREGEEFLFDHSRYHEVTKTGNTKRVVLILDVKRF